MALNPSIILAGQAPDIIGAMDRGAMAAQRQNQIQQDNALRSLFQTQGRDIMSGDQNALAALAGYDPVMAMGIQDKLTAREDAATARADASTARERGNWAWERQLEEYAASKSAAELKAERDAIGNVLDGAAFFYQQGDRQGFADHLQKNGIDPQKYQFDQFPSYAAEYEGVLGVLDDHIKRAGGGLGDPTASQKDYAFYAQQETQAGRQPLSFNDWDLQSKRAGGTTVNVGGSQSDIGTIPQGYAAIKDPTQPSGYRMERITGGPEDNTAAQDIKTGIQSVKSDNVNSVIADVLATNSSAMLPTTGAVGSWISRIGGTAAGDMAANLKTLKAAAAFGSLQAMRDSSPTGGALGSIAVQELQLLESELASLEQSQTQEQFLRNLSRFQTTYNDIVHGKGNWTLDDVTPPAPGSGSPPPAGGLSPDAQAAWDRY